jgi:hypothetical protein
MQFVNFTQIMSRPIPTSKKEAEFALSALMEIPEQFKAALSLQLLGYFLVHQSKPGNSDRPLFISHQICFYMFLGQKTKRISEPASAASTWERWAEILWMVSSKTD